MKREIISAKTYSDPFACVLEDCGCRQVAGCCPLWLEQDVEDRDGIVFVKAGCAPVLMAHNQLNIMVMAEAPAEELNLLRQHVKQAAERARIASEAQERIAFERREKPLLGDGVPPAGSDVLDTGERGIATVDVSPVSGPNDEGSLDG